MRRRDFLRLSAFAGASATFRARASEARTKARVVIVGGGFGGSSCALELRGLNQSMDVTLVDPDLRYVTCPMSNEALIGLRDLASLTVTRAGLAAAGVRHVRDRATAIDAKAGTVRTAGGTTIAFDRLVVAPGIRFLWGTPEGYDEAASAIMPHAWKAGDQTKRLAIQLRAMKDGGVVAISVPSGLMRCPPAPYERASLIAGFLKAHKPRSKILIFDANNHFPRQDVFTAEWRSRYPGMIDWLAMTPVLRVDTAKTILHTAKGAQPVAVANVIAPQAPGEIAADAGLATGHGWCPVDPVTFESKLVPRVHVVGDACIAGAMPKSASSAHSQARRCAAAIAALLDGRTPSRPTFDSVCYSLISPKEALSIHGKFEVADGQIRPADEPSARMPAPGADEAMRAQAWYRAIRAEAFGV